MSWIFALVLGMVVSFVQCQRNFGTSDTQIVSEHKLPFIAGLQFGRPSNSNLPSNCFCLPVNQACPSVPLSVLLKVSSSDSGSTCADSGQKLCCPPGSESSPASPSRPTQAVVPSPGSAPNFNFRPSSVGTGGCGISSPIPYRQADLAEADFGEYPWMALVLDLDNNYVGGGALISPEWVLTAAHVINSAQMGTKVRLGDYDVGAPQDHPEIPHVETVVTDIVIHPNFDRKSLVNDVALLNFRPVEIQALPHIGTVCLPEPGQLFFSSSENCWVTGWGKDKFSEDGSYQFIMKEVDVPMIDPFVCEARLQRTRLGPTFNLNSKAFVCAGGVPGKDACTGDGGSPLVCRTSRGWTVTGLVAWGIRCAEAEVPGVYVNVANYVNFIRQYVRV
ncbi:phenoloxidase-activating factor 2-like isoform X2 [Macrobrachium rosenbergii]|uniref:phenoloxidase-activating factor 2-like isoform X2 n=1 Tax=Macrobrachium rosenbergii TaxID=79674 RepID=UPI0034D72D01